MSRRSSNVIDPSIDRARLRRERGVALAALLAGITIMFIGMGAAASSWSYIIQDNDEQELLFRGLQIVKALKRLQLMNERPPSLDYLVKKKQLRREYLDPMTERDPAIKGAWRYIHDGQPLDLVDCAAPMNAAQPGGQPGQPGQPGQQQPGFHPQGGRSGEILSPPSGLFAYLFAQPLLATAEANDDDYVRMAQDNSGLPHTGVHSIGLGETTGGPIIGVRSRSEKQSLRVFWGKNKYKDWCFTDQTVPDSVVSTERMTDPKGGPPPQFDNVPEERHPWTPPDR
jgi:hypothetical protein